MTESRAGITRSFADQTEITQDIPPAGPPPPAPGPPGFDVKAIVGPGKRPRGIVVSQVPGGGTRLATGQAVTLHVSNGQPVTTTTATTAPTTTASTTRTAPGATARVPDVVGQDDVSGRPTPR